MGVRDTNGWVTLVPIEKSNTIFEVWQFDGYLYPIHVCEDGIEHLGCLKEELCLKCKQSLRLNSELRTISVLSPSVQGTVADWIGVPSEQIHVTVEGAV